MTNNRSDSRKNFTVLRDFSMITIEIRFLFLNNAGELARADEIQNSQIDNGHYVTGDLKLVAKCLRYVLNRIYGKSQNFQGFTQSHGKSPSKITENH